MLNGVYSSDLFMDYKLDKMNKTNDTIEYNIVFNVTKDEKGNYKVVDLSNSDLEKYMVFIITTMIKMKKLLVVSNFFCFKYSIIFIN